MALGTNHILPAALDTAKFVPEIWSDEIFAAHKRNVVLAGLVRPMNVKGKKGDTINLPVPARGSASQKSITAQAQVTLIAETGTGIQISLNQHWEYSRLLEDFAEAVALSSIRKFYTDDGGHALAVAKDTYLFNQVQKLQNATVGDAVYSNAYIAGDGATLYVDAAGNANSTAITDSGIRRSIQRLDDQFIPMTDRFLVVPPVGRRVMSGIARFTEQAFVGDGASIRNGKLGDVYGVSVHVSPNCPTPTTGTTVRIGVLAHRNAIVLANVLGPRVQTQYKQEYLATLLTADTIFGAGVAYTFGGVALAMPSA